MEDPERKAAALRSEPARAASRERIRATLVAQVVDLSDGRLRPGEVDPSAPLLEHGYVDSLSAVTLLEFLRERYGVEISETDLVRRIPTLDALAEHVRRESEVA